MPMSKCTILTFTGKKEDSTEFRTFILYGKCICNNSLLCIALNLTVGYTYKSSIIMACSFHIISEFLAFIINSCRLLIVIAFLVS